MLGKLVSRDVANLIWQDYQDLFGPHLPAGTYEELRYYVPYFVDYLFENKEHRLDLVTAWAGFTAYNEKAIEKDCASDYIIDVHTAFLEEMIQSFDIIHFDKEACVKKGWGLSHFDYVIGSESVNEFLTDLWSFEIHKDVVIKFIEDICEFNEDMNKCGWYVELSRSRYDVYKPTEDKWVHEMLGDHNKLSQAMDLVLKNNFEGTYWDDAFNLLGT